MNETSKITSSRPRNATENHRKPHDVFEPYFFFVRDFFYAFSQTAWENRAWMKSQISGNLFSSAKTFPLRYSKFLDIPETPLRSLLLLLSGLAIAWEMLFSLWTPWKRVANNDDSRSDQCVASKLTESVRFHGKNSFTVLAGSTAGNGSFFSEDCNISISNNLI